MSDEQTRTLRDDFLDLFRMLRVMRLATIDQLYQRAQMAGQPTDALTSERQTLLDLPAKVDTDDRAALVALWPTDSLGEMPLWFSDPAAAAAIDPPTTQALVVSLEEPPIPTVPEGIEPPVDLHAKAIETRESRKADDDARRTQWLAEVAEKNQASKIRLGIVNEKRQAKGWEPIDEQYWEDIGEDQETALRSR